MEEEIVTNPLSYGWGCNLPTDQLWQTMQMDLSHLPEVIERSRTNRIFDLGASDQHVSDLEGRWSFKLCHESDLHFVSRDRQLLEHVATMWDRKGFAVKISPYTAVQAPREWRKMDLSNQEPPTPQ